MKIIKGTLRDFYIRHSISIFDIYFLLHKKVKSYALQYNSFYGLMSFLLSSMQYSYSFLIYTQAFKLSRLRKGSFE